MLIKPIVFLTFSLSSASLDLKLPDDCDGGGGGSGDDDFDDYGSGGGGDNNNDAAYKTVKC